MYKTADLYRMKTDQHTCPFGLKSRHLLKKQGYQVTEHILASRDEVNQFKSRHGVKTTPQTFMDDKRIGGYSDLETLFGIKAPDPNALTYIPVITIFVVAALMALTILYASIGLVISAQNLGRLLELFVAITVCLLAVQKLQDVERFSTSFLNYDLLAQKWVPYARIYPYAEAVTGILMLSGALIWLAAPLMLTIGGIGTFSVFKAVYIEKRDLKCACVGGGKNVPLGFISLTENLFMVGMGIWMMIK